MSQMIYGPWKVQRLLDTPYWVIARTWICDGTKKSGQELHREGASATLPARVFNCPTAAAAYLKGITPG